MNIGMVCFVCASGILRVLFKLYHKLFGLWLSAKAELAGLDIPEMGGLGYNLDWEPAEIPELTRGEGVALTGTV